MTRRRRALRTPAAQRDPTVRDAPARAPPGQVSAIRRHVGKVEGSNSEQEKERSVRKTAYSPAIKNKKSPSMCLCPAVPQILTQEIEFTHPDLLFFIVTVLPSPLREFLFCFVFLPFYLVGFSPFIKQALQVIILF